MERIHSLYLHVPFCTWLCKYCDFNAYAVLEGLIPAYVDALAAELRTAAEVLPIGPLNTVFIGGGTPSLLSSGQLSVVMAAAAELGLTRDAEVTMEVNPSNVTIAGAQAWRAAGVNRLSLGVQSLQPGALRFLERLHSGADALAALRIARAAGLTNVNADLLYGVPGVSTDEWLATVDAIIAEGVTHLSAYELTVEPATRLAQEVRAGSVAMPDAELQLEQYWAAAGRLEGAGFGHYEISNWARPGFESRHNLAGWLYRPYLGCGAGAHSMFRYKDGRTERRWNIKGPHAYIKRIGSSGDPLDGAEVLAPDRARGEAAMIGVRMLGGTEAAKPFPRERARLAAAGLLTEEHDLVRLTPRGVELANQVGAAFLA